MSGAGAGRSERQDARSGPDIDDPFASETETADELGKALAADEIARMKDRWAHR